MLIADAIVPQIGEGLREALITKLLKEPGDPVAKDEPLFEMETDKATLAVESAHHGRLQEWLVKEGDVVAIGAAVARISTDDTPEHEGEPFPPEVEPRIPSREKKNDIRNGNAIIPPRTRAHCRSLGMSEEEMLRIPAPTGKLMPSDVDRYLTENRQTAEGIFTEHRLPAQQRALGYRLRRSAELVIPGTITCVLPGDLIGRVESFLQQTYPQSPLTKFEILAYCVIRSIQRHPSFRSVLTDQETVREYKHTNLGIAVHSLNDALITAVVRDADTLSITELARSLQEQIAQALKGGDQSDASTQFIFTYLADSGITQAIPVLVAPAIGILFVGSPHPETHQGQKPDLNLTLTFDHRLINGIGAARFLKDVVAEVDALGIARGPYSGSTQNSAEGMQPKPILASLGSATEKDKRTLLESHLRTRVSEMMCVPASAVNAKTPLRTQGFKSLMSVQLSQRLAQDLSLALPASLVFDYPSVSEMASFIMGELRGRPLSYPAPSVSGDDQKEAQMRMRLAEISDMEAADLLEQRLSELEENS
ncbi:MAG: 2-oxo acid dehydrogenase subunit E2 [Terriglobia bacterium]